MSLTSGSRLGPYEVLDAVGAGGMGDVYRAKDVRLDRTVAIKTIKGPFTERFEREAKAISALNHPNICTLYDVGETNGSGYLVMEYIDGKPLAGPLPVDQAIAYGIQICEALSAAHKKGITHRDLKPANILLTKQGVKLLDFGLAKLAPAAGNGSSAGTPQSGELATVAALTGAHMVVGTPQYMAPEQIGGGDVDARTDIFAFGCVLYELLTGQRAFDGKSASSIMASVLAMTPRPVSEVVTLSPPALDRIVARCLAKDPEDRWQTARDVAAELQWVAQGGSQVGLPAVVTVRRKTREGLAWGVAAIAALAAVGLGVAWTRRAPAPLEITRFAIPLPDGTSNPTTPQISPDGRKVVFVAGDTDGKRQIWLRTFDSLTPRALGDADANTRPFWAPDSRSIAFMVEGKLRRQDVGGGPAQTICDAPRGSDGTWSADGVILFDGRTNDPIFRVPASGGVAKIEVAEDPSKHMSNPGWPEFLPDGRHYLFTHDSGSDQELAIGLLDSPDVTPLFKVGSRVEYAEPGYLLFVRENTLVAQKFNAGALKVEGDATPIGEGLGVDAVGLASFSVSRNGVLAFREGELGGRRLVWMDRTGKETPAIDGVSDFRDTSFSPDGKRLAFDAGSPSSSDDIWIRDFARGVTERFTFDPAIEQTPVWSPDGKQIVYTSRAKGPGDLYIKEASGARDAEPLLQDGNLKLASDWSRDGKYLIFTEQGQGSFDIYALPMTGGDRKPFPVVKTSFAELFATFSPDTRYIAYQSNASGRAEVYVQEFPEATSRVQVSTNGGTEPFWRGDGKELFYRAGGRIMSVPVQLAPSFSAGTPVQVLQTTFAAVTLRGHYRPTADGQRFLLLAPLGRDSTKPASIVMNWTVALPGK
jgi:eukaryotic-like serine/threonine-protein kinase